MREKAWLKRKMESKRGKGNTGRKDTAELGWETGKTACLTEACSLKPEMFIGGWPFIAFSH